MKNLLLLIFVLASFAALAQSDIVIPKEGNIQIIELKDGTKLIGRITEVAQDSVKIESSVTEVWVLKSVIVSVKEIKKENMKGGEYWYDNPHPTRYLFGPSAIPLKKGEGYYHNAYVLANSVNYAFTDQLSIGAGLELISTALGVPVYFINAKLSFPAGENFYLGGGLISIGMADLRNDGYGDKFNKTLGFGILTYGNNNSNITFGAGFPVKLDYSDGALPAFSISGMARASKRIAFVSENYLVGSRTYGERVVFNEMFSYGIRFMGENISLDFALLNNSDMAPIIPIGIPYVDFAVKFYTFSRITKNSVISFFPWK